METQHFWWVFINYKWPFSIVFCLLYVYKRVPQLGHCFPTASHKNPRLVPREVPSTATGQSRSPFQGAPFGSRKMFMVSFSVENKTFIFMLSILSHEVRRSSKVFIIFMFHMEVSEVFGSCCSWKTCWLLGAWCVISLKVLCWSLAARYPRNFT